MNKECAKSIDKKRVYMECPRKEMFIFVTFFETPLATR